jgi:hypothetical protein
MLLFIEESLFLSKKKKHHGFIREYCKSIINDVDIKTNRTRIKIKKIKSFKNIKIEILRKTDIEILLDLKMISNLSFIAKQEYKR